jgi:predicted RNase H-like HicB family nuclease
VGDYPLPWVFTGTVRVLMPVMVLAVWGARLFKPGAGTMTYRIRLLETDEGWSVSCLDLPGCHSQGSTRDDALSNIREAISLWLEVEAEEAGVKSVETLELAV